MMIMTMARRMKATPPTTTPMVAPIGAVDMHIQCNGRRWERMGRKGERRDGEGMGEEGWGGEVRGGEGWGGEERGGRGEMGGERED